MFAGINIAVLYLLPLLAVYVIAYRSDFRRNRRETTEAFAIVLPVCLFAGWLFYKLLIFMFTAWPETVKP